MKWDNATKTWKDDPNPPQVLVNVPSTGSTSTLSTASSTNVTQPAGSTPAANLTTAEASKQAALKQAAQIRIKGQLESLQSQFEEMAKL